MLRIVHAPSSTNRRKLPVLLTLASRNLFHDRVRLIATVVGIVFSIVLVTVQLGVFVSFERMITMMIDHAQADFWIAPARNQELRGILAAGAGASDFRPCRSTASAEVIAGHRRLCVVAQAEWRRVDAGLRRRRAAPAPPDCSPGTWSKAVLTICRRPTRSRSTAPISSSSGSRRSASYAEINNQKARVAVGHQRHPLVHDHAACLHVARARAQLPRRAAEQGQLISSCASRRTPMPPRSAAGSRRTCPTPRCSRPTEFRSRSRLFWLFDTGAGAALPGKRHPRHHRRHHHRRADALFEHEGPSQGICDAARHRLVARIHPQGHPRRRRCSARSSASPLRRRIGLALVQATADAALPIVMTPELTFGLFVLTIAMCAIAADFGDQGRHPHRSRHGVRAMTQTMIEANEIVQGARRGSRARRGAQGHQSVACTAAN